MNLNSVEKLNNRNSKIVSTPATPTDFRLFLQQEFVRRCKTNSRYSLRAFARTLKTNPSTLSQLLRAKRPITPSQQAKLGICLGLTPNEMAQFESATPKALPKKPSPSPIREAQELTLDAFHVIADWYHYAIFELVTIRGFDPSPRWIARKLGITATEAAVAVERLIRLGLLRVLEDGRITQGPPLITTTGNPFTAVAFRKLQSQVLQMAQVALESIPLEVRDQTSMTIACNTRRIAEVKEKLKKFRRELCDDLQKDTDRDAVYQLGLSFYPLTRADAKKPNKSL